MKVFVRYFDKPEEMIETRILTVVDGPIVSFHDEDCVTLDLYTDSGMITDVLDIEVM